MSIFNNFRQESDNDACPKCFEALNTPFKQHKCGLREAYPDSLQQGQGYVRPRESCGHHQREDALSNICALQIPVAASRTDDVEMERWVGQHLHDVHIQPFQDDQGNAVGVSSSQSQIEISNCPSKVQGLSSAWPTPQPTAVTTLPYQCWDHGCDSRTFSNEANFRRHLREKNGYGKRWVCMYCKKHFSRSSACKRHIDDRTCRKTPSIKTDQLSLELLG